MNRHNKSSIIALVAVEFVVGIILSAILFRYVSFEDEFYRGSYLKLILSFYGILSIVFFTGVLSAKIPKAILYSIVCWLLSIVLYTATFNFIAFTLNQRIPALYILLAGIIIGFNFGIRMSKQV